MHRTATDNTKPGLRMHRPGLGPKLAGLAPALPRSYAALGAGAGDGGVAELAFLRGRSGITV